MSAAFKNAKKKLIQTEFRRVLSEKGKQKEVKKIDSPLAKYNEQGQLTCILCKSIVRSEAVWTVHVNAKQHKENVELAKKLKERTNNFTTPLKRSITPPLVDIPTKKIKSILKNSNSSTSSTQSAENLEDKNGIPDDFFDSKNKATAPMLPIKKSKQEAMQVEEPKDNEVLPEGFFDDPKLDAKARNQEYKDPVEEEWERFQKEIREADNKSAAIIAEDQEEATTERQIDEIDEQMKKLSKVLDLEKKKENLIAITNETASMEIAEDSNDEDYDEFDEYLDWRSKKSFK